MRQGNEPHRRTFRKFLILGLQSLVAVFAALLLGEITIRLAGISFPVFETYHPIRGVALKAGMEGLYNKEGSAHIRINSHGFRDREHALLRPAATFRIAVLGDSYTEARQVEMDSAYWAVLERELRGCAALEGKDIEVLSFGVGGYSTAQEYLTLHHDVWGFDPNLVLLAFYPGNDIRDNSRKSAALDPFRIERPYFTLVGDSEVRTSTSSVSTWRRVLYAMIHHSRILQLVNQARRALEVRRMRAVAHQANIGGNARIYQPPVSEEWNDAWRMTEAILKLMNTEIRSHGSDFVVTIVTTPIQVHPDNSVRRTFELAHGLPDMFYADNRIAEHGRRLGFPVVPLAKRFQHTAAENQIFLHGFSNTVMGEGHWNENGHRLAGRILASELCAAIEKSAASSQDHNAAPYDLASKAAH